MATELEIRRNDKDHLFNLLVAQFESSVPKDFNKLVAQMEAKMEAEDVELVRKKFEDWKKL